MVRPLIENLVGIRFGNLVVENQVKRIEKGPSIWRCKCDCGNYVDLKREALYGSGSKKRCNRNCSVNRGNKRTKERVCRYCNNKFMACDTKASVCPECRKPQLCACGCGDLTKNGLAKYLPGHGSRVLTEKMIKGRIERSKKISGDNNPSKKNRKVLSEALKKYWGSLSEEEKKERTKNYSWKKGVLAILHKNRRLAYGGFLSSWEKQLSEYLECNGISRCPRDTCENRCNIDGCDNGWHYEEDRKFWDGKRYYPDFVYRGIVMEVAGLSYVMDAARVIRKLYKIACSGLTVVVITDKSLLAEMRLHTLFDKDIGFPVFTFEDGLPDLLKFLKDTNYGGPHDWPSLMHEDFWNRNRPQNIGA